MGHLLEEGEMVLDKEEDAWVQLESLIEQEPLFQPLLQLPLVARDNSEVTAGMRDETVQVLRCLKVCFDLPAEVLLLATLSMDRFLTKMRALRRHLAVIGVAALHLAARALQPEGTCPELAVLAAVSQCGCTAADLGRMAALMELKLGSSIAATAFDFLVSFRSILGLTGPNSAALEVLAADSACSNFRPCELALVLLHLHIQDSPEKIRLALSKPISDIYYACKINENSLWYCYEVVLASLKQYEEQPKSSQNKQRLVWRLSQRTYRTLRPTSLFDRELETILEENLKLSVE
ncbi:cyclin G [Neocloeon triangulifer]|uniref:cyclin G n=1 Tax=Neocloeon triangulifer TaxID=2078957 RepID=UPI00286F08A1|nr:cyclin G [Neocloeon triangulifer]